MWVLAAIVIVLHFSWRIYTRRSISSQQKKNTNTITEEELVELVKLLATINKGGERISKTIACEKILHCSPSTFDNYVREGIIPPGRKVAGFKELSWIESDFIGIKLKRIRNAVKQ